MHLGKDCAKKIYRRSSLTNTSAKNNKILANGIPLLKNHVCLQKTYATNARMVQY